MVKVKPLDVSYMRKNPEISVGWIETESLYKALAVLELTEIHLLPLPEYWD